MNAAAMMRLSAPPTQTRAGIRNAASDEDAAVDAGFAFLLASHRQRVAPDLDRGGSWREEIEDSTADEPREPDAAERGNETSGRPEEVGTDARGEESRNADGDSSGKPAETQSSRADTEQSSGASGRRAEEGDSPSKQNALRQLERLALRDELNASAARLRAGAIPDGEQAARAASQAAATGNAAAPAVSQLTAQVAGLIIDQLQLSPEARKALGQTAEQPSQAGTNNVQAVPTTTATPGTAAGQPGVVDTVAPPDALTKLQAVEQRQESVDQVVRAGQRPMNAQQANIYLRLDPPDLGVLRVQLEVRGDTLTAHLHASNASAQEALAGRLSELRQTLENAGIQVDRLEVSNRLGPTQPDQPDEQMERETLYHQGAEQQSDQAEDQPAGAEDAEEGEDAAEAPDSQEADSDSDAKETPAGAEPSRLDRVA